MDGGCGEAHGADVALGFDATATAAAVVDNEGNEIFADKIGVMLARDLSKIHSHPTFVVDVKSTGLFHSDPGCKGSARRRIIGRRPFPHQAPRARSSTRSPAIEKSGHFLLQRAVGARL